MSARAAAAIGAAALALAGCGGGGADDAIRDTAAKLDDVRSGTLFVRFALGPHDGADGFRYELRGPFALARRGELPLLDVTYTQAADDERESVRLVSDGRRAWLVDDGRAAPLAAAAERELRSVGGRLGGSDGIAGIDVERWFRDARIADGPAGTDRVTARVDVVNALNDLAALARATGREVPTLESLSARRVDDATRASRIELLTGHDDRLLRRLDLDVDLAFGVPRALRRTLGREVGTRVSLDVRIANANEPVSRPPSFVAVEPVGP